MTDESDPPKRRPRAKGIVAETRLSPARTPYDASTIIKAMRRRLRLILAAMIVALAVAGIVTFVEPPRYVATAEVVLGTAGSRPNAPPASDRTTTELQIITSRKMARAVALGLRLNRDPAFTAGAHGPAGWIERLRGIDQAQTPAAIDRRVVDRLVRGVAARRIEATYSAEIAYTAHDPITAARVANEYAQQYSDGRLATAAPGLSPTERPNARVISGAEPPLVASAPDPVFNLAVGLAIGLVIGLLAALVVERRFAGLTSGPEIEKRLGLHHLGSVPTLASALPSARSPVDAVVEAPLSGFAEAFRSVFMGIRYAGGRGTKVIAITSALPNEGKTTVAACLARSIALGGETIVLVDCDARRRDTSALLAPGATGPGLAQVLRGEAAVDAALVRDAASGAWVLPLTGPPADLSELLSGAAMTALLDELRGRFKRVLIDTAPILPISATRAIATMADVTAIVVRWRATADHAVLTALRLLPPDHVRVAGAILSHVDLRRQVKFGHGDSTFYYQQYSKYYS